MDYNLGQLITMHRNILGLTRNALSVKTGISRTEIIRIEENKRKQPSIHNLKLLSKELHINYIELLIAAKYFTVEDIKSFYNGR